MKSTTNTHTGFWKPAVRPVCPHSVFGVSMGRADTTKPSTLIDIWIVGAVYCKLIFAEWSPYKRLCNPVPRIQDVHPRYC